ncbi:MAG: hypothetical protein IT423_24500 [Pirellulaceae bacterium]|nr:hypothetical protein [Pirellulaceae bacterium]
MDRLFATSANLTKPDNGSGLPQMVFQLNRFAATHDYRRIARELGFSKPVDPTRAASLDRPGRLRFAFAPYQPFAPNREALAQSVESVWS